MKTLQELKKMGKENGTIEYEGKTIYLLDQAYADSTWRDGRNGDLVYRATGVDENNNNYKVTWETTLEWDEHQAGVDYPKHDGDYACSYCEDESNACDWDNPALVEAI